MQFVNRKFVYIPDFGFKNRQLPEQRTQSPRFQRSRYRPEIKRHSVSNSTGLILCVHRRLSLCICAVRWVPWLSVEQTEKWSDCADSLFTTVAFSTDQAPTWVCLLEHCTRTYTSFFRGNIKFAQRSWTAMLRFHYQSHDQLNTNLFMLPQLQPIESCLCSWVTQ